MTVQPMNGLANPQTLASAVSQSAYGPVTATGPRPLRVLQVTARYFPLMGGVETHVYEVSRRLAAGGVDVTVLTSDPSGGLPLREEKDGVHIRRVRAYPAERDYYFAPGVYPIITRGAWDVIHCQCYHTLVTPVAMLAAWRAGIPYVLTFHSGGHSSGFRNAIRGIQREVLRPLLARATRLVGVSEFEADFFRTHLRLPARRFMVIPNGSQLPRVTEPVAGTNDGPLIVSVGRLEHYKGHHRLIAALPHILAHRPDAHVRIVGGGPYEADLRRLAHEMGVAERVEIGPIPPSDRQGMASLLSRAALFTLLSDYEAHPVAVMEALALGRPVLVTDTSGLGEIARRWHVPAVPLHSSAADIARAVLDQLDHPVVPQVGDLPTWEGCTAALLDLYQTVARRPRWARE